jgi:hypothetical protein
MGFDEEQTTEILKRAMAAVKDAEIPTELQPLALEKAIDLIAGRLEPSAPSPTATRQPSQPSRADESVSSQEQSPHGKLSRKLKLEPQLVEEVFHYDEADGLRLVIGPSKFDPAKRTGTKQLALLYAAGVQGAGLDEWTSLKDIREVVKDFNRFDSSNHAVTMGQMDDVFLFAGSGAGRKVKVNRQGLEQASDLATRIAGGEVP